MVKISEPVSTREVIEEIKDKLKRGGNDRMKTEEKVNEKKKWAYIEVPNAFVNKRTGKNGREFYSVVVPSGVSIDGTKVGGYRFNAPFSNEPTDFETGEILPDAKYCVLGLPNKPIKLVKIELEEGQWKEVDNIEVEPEVLKQAMRDSYKEYKKNRDQQEPSEKAEQKKSKKSHTR